MRSFRSFRSFNTACSETLSIVMVFLTCVIGMVIEVRVILWTNVMTGEEDYKVKMISEAVEGLDLETETLEAILQHAKDKRDEPPTTRRKRRRRRQRRIRSLWRWRLIKPLRTRLKAEKTPSEVWDTLVVMF